MSAAVVFALLERVHGHIALLGLAVLLHPVISVRASRRLGPRTQLSAELAALLLTLATALGWWVYPDYRQHVKPLLLDEALAVMWWFERKEHLAFACWALAVSGALVLRAAPESPAGRRAGRALLALAFACGVVVAVIGMVVAATGQGLAG